MTLMTHPLLAALETRPQPHPLLEVLGTLGDGTVPAIPAADLLAGNYSGALTQVATDTLGFDPTPIVGSALDDAQTAASVAATFSQSAIDYTGDQGKEQVKDIALALNLIPGVGTVIGGAILAITSAVGFAHAGAGVCATDPPPGAGWGDLKAWPHYISWADSGANQAPAGQAWTESTDPAGSFESYANLALAYNRALDDNCFSNVAVPAPQLPALLATLITAWNKTHAGPARTVSRLMPCGQIGCTAPGYDPIADALNSTDLSGGLAGKTLQFQVQGGPAIKVIKLRLPTPPANPPAAPSASSASSSSAGKAVAVVAVTAGVGTAIWAGVTGRLAGLAKALRF